MQTASPSADPLAPTATAAPLRLLRLVLVLAVVVAPLAFAVGAVLNPAVGGTAADNISRNAHANGVTNQLHIVGFVVASLLLPLSMIGLAYPARVAAPWLSTLGGLVGVLGWLPLSALTAQDDLTRTIATMPTSTDYTDLWQRFTTDTVINTYLLLYAAGHLVAYVLLGLALRRARAVPAWAAWLMIASSPITIVGFAVPALKVLIYVGVFAVFVASVPAARTLNTEAPAPPSPIRS
jgi:hypothetical protein